MNLPSRPHDPDIISRIRQELATALGTENALLPDTTRDEIGKLLFFLNQQEADSPTLRQANSFAPSASAGQMDSSSEIKPAKERRNSNRSSLAHIPLFNGVNKATLASLLSRCRFQDLAKDQILLRSGTANDKLFVIMSGTVGVHLDGSEQPFVSLSGGECVGEMSILGDMKVSANVIASEQCRLMVIHRDLVWNLIRASSEFARNMLYTLAHRMQRSMRRQRETAREASLDPLTGLHNRRSFSELFLIKKAACCQSGNPLSLLMLDIDHFKRFNDNHGHLSGDVALCAVADTLVQCIEQGVVGRFGGEEFVILLPESDTTAASELADSIRIRIQNLKIQGASAEFLPSITISIGVATANPQQEDLDSLIRAADLALYEAKRLGRNRVVVSKE